MLKYMVQYPSFFALLLSGAVAGGMVVDTSATSNEQPGYRRGVQRCHTLCQSRKTDCILACDGETECELDCQRQAEACARRCQARAAPRQFDGGPGDGGHS